MCSLNLAYITTGLYMVKPYLKYFSYIKSYTFGFCYRAHKWFSIVCGVYGHKITSLLYTQTQMGIASQSDSQSYSHNRNTEYIDEFF